MDDTGCVFGTKKKNSAVAQRLIEIVTNFHQFPSCKVHQRNEHGMKQHQTQRLHNLIFQKRSSLVKFD